MLSKMKKKLSNQELCLNKFKRKRKRIIIRSVILVIFLFGVNTFAWFTYISRADLSINSSVVSWEVNFMDQNSIVKDIHIMVTDMRPGMMPFSKTIRVLNYSDVAAQFSYQINSLKILGIEQLGQKTTEEMVQVLKEEFPFSLTFTFGKDLLEIGDTSDFVFLADWVYEDNKYYKVNSLYQYDPSIFYYTYVDNDYQIDSTVTSENFLDKVSSGLYVFKDDADSYFGQACGKYEREAGKGCIDIQMELKVTQVNK